MAGQRGGHREPVNVTRVLTAMQVEAVMDEANRAVAAETKGERLARLAGKAARAAYLAVHDADNPDTIAMYPPIAQVVVHQAYCGEWQRLMSLAEEEWWK